MYNIYNIYFTYIYNIHYIYNKKRISKYILFFFNLFYLVAAGLSCGRRAPLVAARGLLSCGMQTLSFGMHMKRQIQKICESPKI